MATKKTKSVKRFITVAEHKKFKNGYYRLKNSIYNLIESDKLNATAKAELKKFYAGLEKANRSISWGKATNYKAS